MGARQSEAVACRASKYAVAQAIVISFGGFIFGYDLGALSSATQSLRSHFQLSPAIFGTTISFSLWGTVVGSVLAGRWADRMNRRTLIEICAVLYALAAVGVTLPAPSEWAFILSMRFVCGVAIGGFTVACPLYLAELAPSGLRGRFVSLFQVQIGFGVVVAFAAGSIFVRLSPPSEVWRWCLGAGTVPAALLLLLLRVVFRDASRMTGSARATCDKVAPASSVVSKCSASINRLFRGRNKRAILLATSIAVFNQLSGVNILLLYVLGYPLQRRHWPYDRTHVHGPDLVFEPGDDCTRDAHGGQSGSQATLVRRLGWNGNLSSLPGSCDSIPLCSTCLLVHPGCLQCSICVFSGNGSLGVLE